MQHIVLRPDQADLKAGVYNSWNSGNRNVLAVLPTGGGKSIVVSDIILDGHNAGMNEAVIAHRNELVAQMSLHVARRGIKHRIIASKKIIGEVTAQHRDEFKGRSFINPDAKTAVCSIDTLNARAETLKPWAQRIDRWTIDEAHHVLEANKWGTGTAMFPNAYGLGVTASPRRADGQGLGADYDGVFHDMIVGPDMRWLINNGALSDYDIIIPSTDFQVDDSDFNKDGELSPKKGRLASQKAKMVGNVVIEYIKWVYGKRFICFATDVETAKEMAQDFQLHGIPCAAVDANTPAAVRNEYIRRFRSGQLWGLINVDLFGEGFDVPACEVVIMARPTGSLAVYLQQFGRALRVMLGKTHGIIIDHVSNWKRHGFPDDPHAWSLARRDKRAKKLPDPEMIGLIGCLGPGCGRPYEAWRSECPRCGWSPPLPEPRLRTIEQVAGDMMLLTREMIQKMRMLTELESPAEMGQRVAMRAGANAGKHHIEAQIKKIGAQNRAKHAFAQWAAIQRMKGRSDSESHRRIYKALGMDMYAALAATRTTQDYENLADLVEGWCHV